MGHFFAMRLMPLAAFWFKDSAKVGLWSPQSCRDVEKRRKGVDQRTELHQVGVLFLDLQRILQTRSALQLCLKQNTLHLLCLGGLLGMLSFSLPLFCSIFSFGALRQPESCLVLILKESKVP
jgi:hypothetical protein